MRRMSRRRPKRERRRQLARSEDSDGDPGFSRIEIDLERTFRTLPFPQEFS
jgi:hypothetical protein